MTTDWAELSKIAMTIDWAELNKIAATVFLSTVSGLIVAIVAYKLGAGDKKQELDLLKEQNKLLRDQLDLQIREAVNKVRFGDHRQRP